MKTKTLLSSIAMTTLILIGACRKDTYEEILGVCPLVISTNPGDGDINVPIDQIITITFNQTEIDPATISNSSITITGDNPVTGTVTFAGATATFTPSSPLTIDKTYTGVVKTTVTDKMGNALQENYVWAFSTGEIILPMVASTDPINNETAVNLDRVISATFNMQMDPGTIDGSSFSVSKGGTPLAGTVTYAGTTAFFTPSNDLDQNSVYTATITADVKNTFGTAMAAQYVWSFTTDTLLPPTVISTSPIDSARGVSLNANITADFSEPMDITTMNDVNFTLSDSGVLIPGAVTYNGVKITFNPTNDLLPGKTYKASISNAVTNIAGTNMIDNYTWTFFTDSVTVAIPPTVIITDPLNNATNVPLNKLIRATFSLPMNGATITGSSYTVMEGANPIMGTVTYNASVATFTPSQPLESGKTYTATIKNTVTNVAGTAMTNDYIWSFTAEVLLPPTVVSTNPLDLATAVSMGTNITATFDQIMNATTLNALTFTVREGANPPIAGIYSYAGMTSTFNPSSDLKPNTTYTATITTGAQSAGGMGLANNYVWTFTTMGPSGPMNVDLDCVEDYAVIAGSTVTNTGGTIVTGDLGLSPGTAVIGFPPGIVVGGIIRVNDSKTNAAKLCLTNAYIDAAGRSLNFVNIPTGELGGLTLGAGLYRSGISSFDITSSDLILDAKGNPDAVWIFQMPSSTLTVGNGVKVTLIGGAKADNIYWSVGTSATIGTTAEMKGNILADQSVTLMTGASLLGRALTRIAAVTLDFNAVTKP